MVVKRRGTAKAREPSETEALRHRGEQQRERSVFLAGC